MPSRAGAAPQVPPGQDGVALFVCLVVLLVLGVAGAAASQTVSLEARMARNGHDGELALQAAESALREGERLVASSGFDPDAPGFHEAAAYGAPAPWSLAETWRGAGSRIAAALAQVAEPPRVHGRTDRLPGDSRCRHRDIQGDRARRRGHGACPGQAAEHFLTGGRKAVVGGVGNALSRSRYGHWTGRPRASSTTPSPSLSHACRTRACALMTICRANRGSPLAGQ